MSWQHALSPQRTALVSAAMRHLDDAVGLLSSSPVQAFHLAGFAPECARKAALTLSSSSPQAAMDKAIGHGFDELAERALVVACDLDPLASRYQLRDWSARFPALRDWTEQSRYQSSDARGASEVRPVVDAAVDAVAEVVAALWADGRLPALDALAEVRP